jgi:hypothetical protein
VTDAPDAPDAPDELRAAMGAAARELVEGVERLIPAWAVRGVERILVAWDRLDPDELRIARERAVSAGAEAARRVADDLRALFEHDVVEQAATPLQVVRSAIREPTAVLVSLGIPPVDRDPFDERAHPEDRYDLVPRSLADLGDPDLGAQLLVWGMAKAKLLRRGSEQPG